MLRTYAAAGACSLCSDHRYPANARARSRSIVRAQHGGRHPGYQEQDGQRVMKQAEITVRVLLHRGDASTTVWTCDLSLDYVRINADYRS